MIKHTTSAFLFLIIMLLATQANAGEIALSFDDAPTGASPYMTGLERTEMLIGKLDSLEIEQVVFFVKTDQLPFHNGRMRLDMYVQAGHILANHSHSHNHPYEVGASAYIEDIRVADSILAEIPGSVKWYRFPYLNEGSAIQVRDSIRQALDSMHYQHGYVTVDNYDWYLNKLFRDAVAADKQIDMEKLEQTYVEILWNAISFYDSVAVEALERSPKHVLLLHENDLAALFIDKLIEKIRNEGWTIITPTEAYKDPIAKHLPNILMGYQGRTMAIAREMGHPGPWYYKAEDEVYLDSLMSKSRIFK